MSSVPLNLSAREIVAPFGSRPVADDEFVLFRVAELGNMDANYGLGYINKHQIGVITEFEAAKVSANVGGLDGLRRLGLDKILQVSQNMMYRALVRDKVFSDKVVFRILESVDTGEGLEDFNGSIRFVVLGITKNFKANRKPKELAEKIAESAREGKGIGRGALGWKASICTDRHLMESANQVSPVESSSKRERRSWTCFTARMCCSRPP